MPGTKSLPEWTLRPIRELLVTAKIQVSLLCLWGYWVMLAIVVCKLYRRVKLLISFLLEYLMQHLQGTSPLGRGFQVSPMLICLSPLSRVYNVISDRVSPSTTGKESRATVIIYIILGFLVLLWPLTQKEVPHAWYWSFCYIVYGSLGWVLLS